MPKPSSSGRAGSRKTPHAAYCRSGTGLGKQATGIVRPLRAVAKADSKGVGATPKAGAEYFPWWEAVYNKSAATLGKAGQPRGSKRKKKDAAQLKAEQAQLKTDADWVEAKTDAELFAACGGRTAFKGSRKR